MVDRIELVSQLFWFCLIFWGFYMVLVFYILPRIAFGLKLRRKAILKFECVLSKNSKSLFWSEVLISFFSLEGLLIIDNFIRERCTSSFLESETDFFSEVMLLLNKGESFVTSLNGVRYWGIEPRGNFYTSILERAHLYPWMN